MTDAPVMSQVDIRIAAYRECIEVALRMQERYGALPGVGCRSVAMAIEELMRAAIREADQAVRRDV
jgi:hypothetical protein